MSERDLVFLDFEYRDDGRQVILGCFWNETQDEWVTIDFRRPEGAARLAALQTRWSGAIWLSYSAHAEMSCFLTLGLDISAMDWVDLYCEARQITGSHRHFYTSRGGLLYVLEALGIASRGNVADKEATVQLILGTDQYTPAQWSKIVDYCWSDIEPLRDLWLAIQSIHGQMQHPYPLHAAIFRADYLKAVCELESRSRGFPVDEALLDIIFDNQKLIRNALAKWCNGRFGGELFRYNKLTDKYSFHFQGLAGYIDTLPFKVDWERTKTGRYRLDDEYLRDFVRRNEHFKPLYETRTLLDQLKTADLRPLVREGYIAGRSIAYYTATGRNQPLTSQGYVLNLAPWLRHIVRPKPGYVLLAADWSQEEVVLAASLSGDANLACALASGDVYLAAAADAGAVPHGATAETHPTQRATYKSAILGLAYGMGALKLGQRIYLDLLQQGLLGNKSYDECVSIASDIIAWHRDTYSDYWQYIRRETNVAMARGWCQTMDGWTRFTDANTRYTQLLNFPVQATGAVVLREAIKLLAKHREIEFVASLHDAIYINCRIEDRPAHEQILVACMTEAVATVMGNTVLPLPIKVKVTPYSHQDGYTSKRGTVMFDRIMDLLHLHGV